MDLGPLGELRSPISGESIVVKCFFVVFQFGILAAFGIELCNGIWALVVFGLMPLCSWIEGLGRLKDFARKASTVEDIIQQNEMMRVYSNSNFGISTQIKTSATMLYLH